MVLSHRIERSSLEVGDHIYAWRIAFTYSHHGIYIGDDKVIHFIPHGVVSTSVDEFLSFLILGFSKLRRYKYSSKRTSFVLKQRGTCTTAASDDADTVVHRAKELLKNGFGSYDLGKRNCENFAVYCKTGLRVVNGGGGGEDIAGLCGQVAAVKCKAVVVTTVAGPVVLMGAAVASTGPVGVVIAAVAFTAFAAADLVAPTAFTVVAGGVLYYCKRRLDKDIGIRKDVIKKADVASASDAASASASPSSEEKEQEEEDYRNWTAEQMDHGAAMEAYIPSTSLQILSDLSKHCVPGYCPDALLILPHIKN